MRIALGVEYNGANYSGWQRQQHVVCVQQKLEEALSSIATEDIKVVCAGRTDAGVHGTGQVVHFDTDAQRPIRAWIMGGNTKLPKDIAISWCKEVPDDFHARFSATARRYRYVIYENPYRGAILGHGITHYYHKLNANFMHDAAQALIGKHDFSSFRSVHCQANHPVRTVHSISVERMGPYIMVDVRANAFLHHMVRNIVGTLMQIGSEDAPVAWMSALLALKDRTKAAAMAKPNGLYLVDVTYPEKFELPHHHLGPVFWPQ